MIVVRKQNMKKHQGNVFVSGKNLLDRAKSKTLVSNLRSRDIKEVDKPEDADVVIMVKGDSQQERIVEIQKLGKRFFMMNPNEPGQGDYTFNLMSGIATFPYQAAQWAWSMIHEPEKWTTIGKEKNEKA